MKIESLKSFYFLALMLGMNIPSQAANPSYNAGDLLLYFQRNDGVTVSNTVYIKLGSATTFRGTATGPGDVANMVDFLDINSTLNTAFNTEAWASDPTIYAGLAGCYTSEPGSDVVNGDANQTLYVSAARFGVGTIGAADSTARSINGTTGFGTASGNIVAQNNVFGDTDTLNPNGYSGPFIVSNPSISKIDDNNPIINTGGIITQGTAFGVWGGGVQQLGSASAFGSFGAGGTAEFALDLYRLVRTNSVPGDIDGIISGVTRTGTYEGTIVINTSGKVSFITQGAAPSSAYTTWMSTFTSITAPADKLEGADPDMDGIENVLEFVLNGNPSVSSQTILPTLDASGSNFVFSFTRRADSAGEATQVFEYSTDLVDWTTKAPITIPTTPGTVGAVTVGASTGTAPNQVQAVTVSVPKVPSETKLFGRLKAVK